MVCPHWLSCILYNPVRKYATDRIAVLRQSRITRDSVVLEIGAGNGFFTEVLAGHAAFVHAVELQEGMVKKLKRRLGALAGRVKIIREDISRYDPGQAFADVAFVYYAFHEVDDQEKGSRAIAQAVKPKGFLALYEPTVEVGRRKMDATVALFEQLGMVLEERKDGFFTRFALLRKGT